MYSVHLLKHYSVTVLNKFKSYYHKCIKKFFSYARSDSMTSILLHLKLPSFATVTHNASVTARRQRLLANNGVIQYFSQLVL